MKADGSAQSLSEGLDRQATALKDVEITWPDREPGKMRGWEIFLLVLITLAGALLRLYQLDNRSVWYDEAFSIAHAVRPVAELMEILIGDAFHPPLYHFLLREWFEVLGFGVVQARLVSVIPGTLSILLIYFLARRFTTVPISLCAAFLLAISQVGIHFSQEARAYALVQCLSLAAALAFLRFLRQPGLWTTTLFSAISIVLVYLHYYAAGTLIGLGLYWLVFRREHSKTVFIWLLGSALVILLAFVPWVILLRSGAEHPQSPLVSIGDDLARKTLRPRTVYMAINRFNNGNTVSIHDESSYQQSLPGMILFTLPAAVALFYTWGRAPQGLWLGLLLVGTPLLMALLAGSYGVIFNFRHYSFALPGYYLAVAIGWRVCLRNSVARLAWIVAVIGITALSLPGTYAVTKPDYRTGFLPLAKGQQAGDCVAFRPMIWSGRIHLAYEVYYQAEHPLKFLSFPNLASESRGCNRIWLVWDKTKFMNTDPTEVESTRLIVAQVLGHFRVIEKYEHSAADIQLLERY